MILKWFNKVLGLVVIALLFGLVSTNSVSWAGGHIQPIGVTEEQSSQLIYWYNQDDAQADSILQVTNSSNKPVDIQVQVFKTANGDGRDSACDVRDFEDSLTGEDTHLYKMGDLVRNEDMSPALGGDVDGTQGFVIITAIDENVKAISWQHLFGSFDIRDNSGSTGRLAYRANAMGRDAVNVATGELTPEGDVLDGTTNALVLLQPSILKFNFTRSPGFADNNFANIVFINFVDNYGVEYKALPAASTYTRNRFDDDEVRESFGQRDIDCFLDFGLNVVFPPGNGELPISPPDSLLFQDDSTPIGWAKIFPGDLGAFENLIGLAGFIQFSEGPFWAGIDWMFAE